MIQGLSGEQLQVFQPQQVSALVTSNLFSALFIWEGQIQLPAAIYVAEVAKCGMGQRKKPNINLRSCLCKINVGGLLKEDIKRKEKSFHKTSEMS